MTTSGPAQDHVGVHFNHSLSMETPVKRTLEVFVLMLGLFTAVLIGCQDDDDKSDQTVADEPTGRLDLNGAWKWMADARDVGRSEGWYLPEFADEDWFEIQVPGSWNYLFRSDPTPTTDHEYSGPGWYRKEFVVDQQMDRGYVRLHFGAVCYRTSVYLNGNFIGEHTGDFVPFEFNVTDDLIYDGRNTLAVRIESIGNDTTMTVPPANGRYDFWIFHGIHREVYLQATGELLVQDLFAHSEPGQDSHPARLSVEATVLNRTNEAARTRLLIQVRQAEGKVVREIVTWPLDLPAGSYHTFQITSDILSAKLWSPEDPYLYELTATLLPEFELDAPISPALLVNTASYSGEGPLPAHATMQRPAKLPAVALDQAAITFGVRKIETKGDQILLNGQPVVFRGVNRHDEYPLMGRTMPDWVYREDLAMMKRAGVNAIRTAHYMNDPRIYQMADELGFLVIEEIPAVALNFKEMGDPEIQKLCVDYTRGMVIRDRNHPSIVIWSAADEPTLFGSSEFNSMLYAQMKLLDPTRLVTYARLHHDLIAEDPEADVICLNPYWGWYIGEIEKTDWFLDLAHETFPDKPVILCEFGAGALKNYRQSPLDGEDYSPHYTEDFQVQSIKEVWDITAAKEFAHGGFVWVWADFISPTRKYLRSTQMPVAQHVINPAPYHNLKGLVTRDRIPKAAYLMLMGLYGDHQMAGLTIKVVDDSEAAVLEATVDIYLEDSLVGRQVTDAAGLATLSYVPELTYTIKVAKDDLTAEKKVTVQGDTDVTITLDR